MKHAARKWVGAVVFAGLAAFGGLWMLSSASLACTYCNCDYSLFHPLPRCRQPYIALVLAVVASSACVACVAFALLQRRRAIKRP